jgi:hypothetical protein
MAQCKHLEKNRIPITTPKVKDYVEHEQCRLGNKIPLGGCLHNCPDFE